MFQIFYLLTPVASEQRLKDPPYHAQHCLSCKKKKKKKKKNETCNWMKPIL